jgi:hypothetical protein
VTVLTLGREPALELDGYPPVLVEPAYLWVPERAGTYGPEIVEFAEAIGLPCDVEQACDLDALASFGPGGTYGTGEAWLLEGRQNGKTERVILPWTLFDFFVGGARIVDWTAHLMDTTLKMKRIVDRVVRASTMLSDRVEQIVDARGSEAMYLRQLPGEDAPREWHWASRSDGAGRGGPADVWVADEGLFLSDGMVGARRPTLRARPGAQLRGASSAGLRRSKYLRSVVKRGREGVDPDLVYVERCAPGGFDGAACELGASCSHVYGEETWHMANHGLARGRIAYRKLRSERSSLDPVEFGREGAGWHEAGDDDDVTIDVDVWDELEDRSSGIVEGTRPDVFVVGVRPDQAGSSIGVAGRRPDGLLHVGLIRHGTLVGEDLVAEVLELRRKHRPRRVVVLGGPGSATVAALLGKRVPKLHIAGPGEQAASAASLLAGLKGAGDFRHLGDRHVRASLEAVPPRRTPDGGWSFDTRVGGDVLPILVVTVARATAAALKPYDPMRSFG